MIHAWKRRQEFLLTNVVAVNAALMYLLLKVTVVESVHKLVYIIG